MEIISHRGYWKTDEEKNSEVAFARSFSLNFGTETDVRDIAGKLVISHDMPQGGELLFETFLSYYSKSSCTGTLAINIKSDGLHQKVLSSLSLFDIDNYFVFDMSIPDTLVALDNNLKVFIRASEFETENALWEKCDGIWYDSFYSNSINTDMIESQLAQGLKVCIVSSELHKRPYIEQWKNIKKLNKSSLQSDSLILCTDLPELAQDYFND